MNTRTAFSLIAASTLAFAAMGQEAAPAPQEPAEKPATSSAAESNKGDTPEISVGTKAYDAAEIAEMYRRIKEENERRAAAQAPHLNMDHMDVIELAPYEVQANSLRDYDRLLEEIDPQPRRRLQRLAELDPEAAFDLRTTMRAEERFFAGEMDPTYDRNIGRSADFDALTIGRIIGKAFKRDETVDASGETAEEKR